MDLEYIETDMEKLQDFIDNCPYRFTKGKHIDGCGIHNKGKQYDIKDGCYQRIENGDCPSIKYDTKSIIENYKHW